MDSVVSKESDTDQKPSKVHSERLKLTSAKQVRNDIFLFIMSLIVFQTVELFIMFTITMSNERMDLDAPVLYDSVLVQLPRQKIAGKVSEVLLFSYQIL